MSIEDGIFQAVDLSGVSTADKSKEQKNRKIIGKIAGINCGNIREAVPHFVKADCETVIPGKNNSYIVLGRDRPGSIHSGYGGKGNTQCGMIDLVVGRMHPIPKEEFKYEGADRASQVMVDPMLRPYAADPASNKAPASFATDAARIYISQKTNIDENFGLPDGRVGSSMTKSGIGIKADAIRIMGNEGIKLVTGPDRVNSFGQPLTPLGIDLIGGVQGQKEVIEEPKRKSEDGRSVLEVGATMQPLVKGDNLRACLEEIMFEIRAIMSTNQKFVNYVIQFIKHYGDHGHPPPVPYVPVREDGLNKSKARDINNGLGPIADGFARSANNLGGIEKKFLKMNNPKCYINSKYNNTN